MTLQQKTMLDMPFNKIASAKRVIAKPNVKRIENENLKDCYTHMGSWRIIGHTAKHLAYRHRVGLLVTTVAVLCGYIINDKILSIFL